MKIILHFFEKKFALYLELSFFVCTFAYRKIQKGAGPFRQNLKIRVMKIQTNKIKTEKALEKLDLEKEMVKSLKEATDMPGWNNTTWMNVENQELSRTSTSQNTSWDTSNQIMLWNFVAPFDEGFEVEDFLDEEEMKACDEEEIEYWDFIKELKDFDVRLVNAKIFHGEDHIRQLWEEQLDETIPTVTVWKPESQEFYVVETEQDLAKLYQKGYNSFRQGMHGVFQSYEEAYQEPITDIDEFAEWVFDNERAKRA